MENHENKNYFNIDNEITPTISEVGGKGFSLIGMKKFGLNVPPGFILSVKFFRDWVEELKSTEEWKNFLKSDSEDDMILNLNHLKNMCSKLKFTASQNSDLEKAMNLLSNFSLFAVRSSSPEEDLEGASFAGGYETVLGVVYDTLKDAVKKCFASCLDYRVFKYKQEKGINYYLKKY